jgi:hypothetical protein
MSTQTPITTEPTACSTNWLTRLACKWQSSIEPLCEKRSDFELTGAEQTYLETDILNTNQGVSPYYFIIKDRTSAEWWEVIEREDWIVSEGTAKIIAPRLTLWNKLGISAWKAFSVGTECSCCWGWRVIIASFIVFSGGFLIGKK